MTALVGYRYRILIAPGRAPVDLCRVAQLDGDRVAEQIAQAPVTVARLFQQRVVSTGQQADQVSVRGLRQIEDAGCLRADRRLRSHDERLLAAKAVVEEELGWGFRSIQKFHLLGQRDIRDDPEDLRLGGLRQH